jgi:peptidoglycan hydrolase-like protein with peptidoglycan-binding domain
MRARLTTLATSALLVLGIWAGTEIGAGSLALTASAEPSAQSAGSSKSTRSSRRRRRPRRPPGQMRPTPERIREIQEALLRDGWLTGEPTGVWDDATSHAFRRFQEGHGHPVTGKPDALSLIKLGLGPETAGVAAPRPVEADSDSAASAGSNEP